MREIQRVEHAGPWLRLILEPRSLRSRTDPYKLRKTVPVAWSPEAKWGLGDRILLSDGGRLGPSWGFVATLIAHRDGTRYALIELGPLVGDEGVDELELASQ